MLAEFSVVPLDHGMSMKEFIAQTLDIVDKSGLDYELTAMGTIVEGEPAVVWHLLRDCHEAIAGMSNRVETRIVIDDKKAAMGRLVGKVKDVEEVLGRRLKTAV
jgi:uncharacterized protein (TIGR00106 family)